MKSITRDFGVTTFAFAFGLFALGFLATMYIVPEKYINEKPIREHKILIKKEVEGKNNTWLYDEITIKHKALKHFKGPVNNDSLQLMLKKDQEIKRSTRDYKDFLYNQNPYLILWVGLIALGNGLSLGMIPLILNLIFGRIRDALKLRWRSPRLVIFGALTISFLAVWGIKNIAHTQENFLSAFEIIETTQVLFTSREFLEWMVNIFFATPLFALIGLALLYIIILLNVPGVNYSEMKKVLLFFLSTSSIMLVMGILTTHILRKAILQELEISVNYFDLFPQLLVAGYGMILSMFLFVFYVPAIIKIFRGSETDASSKTPKDIRQSNLELIEVIIGVLAPVVSGILIELLKG